MISFTSQRFEGACVVHLLGTFGEDDDPIGVAADLIEEAGAAPLLVDLSGVRPADGYPVRALVRGLAGAPTQCTTVLIHPDLETRRSLRAESHGLPVVPSSDLVLHGCYASALVAHGASDGQTTP